MTALEQNVLTNFNAKLNKLSKSGLRDYFAGQALSGLGEYLMLNRDDFQAIAKTCYNIADAMIEFRKENKNG